MSYMNAPATAMLATNCAFCARPLVDAQSVETGIGPVCRKRYMMADTVTQTARMEANKLIHQIALHQKGAEVTSAIARLEELGLSTVVKRINKRLKEHRARPVGKPVTVIYSGGRIYVETPWVERGTFSAILAKFRSIPGRQYSSTVGNSFPMDQKQKVWWVIKRFFAGREISAPNGTRIIPALQEAA